MIVDVVYPVRGDCVHVSYPYYLFSALCYLHLLKNLPEVSILPLRYVSRTGSLVLLSERSELVLRAPVDKLAFTPAYANQRLQVGKHTIETGSPEIRPLAPSRDLACQRVTFVGAPKERAKLQNSLLAQLGVPLEDLRFGEMTRLRVGVHVQWCIAVQLRNISKERSLRIQATRYGGRGHFGCGHFEPGELPHELRNTRHRTIVRPSS